MSNRLAGVESAWMRPGSKAETAQASAGASVGREYRLPSSDSPWRRALTARIGLSGLGFAATGLAYPRVGAPRLVVARPCLAGCRGEYAQPSSASDGVGTCTRVLRQLTSPKVSERNDRRECSELFGATPALSSTGHPARREGQAFRTPVPSRARPCRHATCPFSLVCVSASIDEAERRREFTPLHSLVK